MVVGFAMIAPTLRQYRYRAVSADGSGIRGVVDAVSEAQAIGVLLDRGLHPTRITPMGMTPTRRAAPRADLAVVFRAVAALVESGVPIERAVGSAEPIARGALGGALGGVRQRLREGGTFAQALEATDGLVPPVVIGMIRAGEHGGRLGTTLGQVADHLEHEAELIARVRQALAYPILVAAAGTVSIIIIGTLVVPRFATILQDLGQTLPFATRLLLAVSDMVAGYGIPACGMALLGGVGFISWRATPRGRLASDAALLQLPVIGSVRHGLATSRVGRALGLLLEAGMPLLAALDNAAAAAGDGAVSERVRRAREWVTEGQPLATSLERAQALTLTAHQLIAVGEATGRIGPMATRAGQLATQEAERSLRTAISLIEPTLIILFGALVAFVAMALLQAVYGLRPMGL